MKFQIDRLKERYEALSEPVKASVWYTICNVLNKGIALISTPIFTRVMTEEQYGTFSIFQSWYSIILIFTSLNIFLGGYTKGLILYKDKRDEFTSTQLSLTTLITCCFGLIYLLNIDFWTKIFDLPPILMGAMFIELTFMPALEFWSAKERFDFKYKKYVIATMIMTVLSLGGGVVAVLNTPYKVEARVFSDVAAKAVFSGSIFLLIILRGKKIFVKEYWKFALRFNLPLIPHYLSNYVLSQSDRLMIGRMVGAEQAAYYSVAYTISMMMTLVMNAINNALTPYIYKTIDAGNERDIKKVNRPIVLLVAGLSIVTMAFAPEVIWIFAGKKYAEAIYVIPPVAASVFFIFLYSMFSAIEYFYEKTGFVAIGTCVSAILNLILNYIFIQKYGYYAAGYTTVICYICLTLTHFFFYRHVLKEMLPEVKDLYDIRLIIIVSISVILTMLFMVFTYRFVEIRYGLIFLLVVCAIWKRKNLSKMLRMFTK